MLASSTTTTTTTVDFREARPVVGRGGGGLTPVERMPLGMLTKCASPPRVLKPQKVFTEAEKADFSRRERNNRYKLQQAAAELLPRERVAECGTRPQVSPGQAAEAVKVMYSRTRDKSHLKNMHTCGSVWTCPVCGYKISLRRRQELIRQLDLARAAGYSFMFVTFTLQHGLSSILAELIKLLKQLYRQLHAGKAYQRFKRQFGLVGSVRGFEFTFSFDNGHHPHLHVILISTLPQVELDKAAGQIRDYYDRHYSAKLAKLGYLVNEHTVNVKTGGDYAGYLTKWSLSHEVTTMGKNGKISGHFTPWQLLQAINDGDKRYIPAFVEYAAAFKGERQLVKHADKNTRLYAIFHDEPEKTDAELAEETEVNDSIEVVKIAGVSWRRVVLSHGRQVIARILEAAELAGRTGQVYDLLTLLCVELKIPPEMITVKLPAALL